jgi:hypothetical protein
MPIRPWVYVTCSFCGHRIKEPFLRSVGHVAFRHSVCKARLLVTPDPLLHDHKVSVLAEGLTWEQALASAIAYEAA